MEHFETTNKFIDQAREQGCVLVHCHAGVSRSASVVIAYLVWKNGWTTTQAFKHIKKSRFIMPNNGFVLQLKEYQNLVRG